MRHYDINLDDWEGDGTWTAAIYPMTQDPETGLWDTNTYGGSVASVTLTPEQVAAIPATAYGSDWWYMTNDPNLMPTALWLAVGPTIDKLRAA